MKLLVVGVFGIAACAGDRAPHEHLREIRRPTPADEIRQGTPPPADEPAIRALLGTQASVLDGGLWFSDPDCAAEFGKAGEVATVRFDVFAKCLAQLQWQPSARRSSVEDDSIVTYGAGFELEAHVADGKLDRIGFTAHASGMPDVPTITPEALEALRTAGDPKAVLDDAARARLEPTLHGISHDATFFTYICLDATGAIAARIPSFVSPELETELQQVGRDWAFKPFAPGPDAPPIAVCAVMQAWTPDAHQPARVPKPPTFARSGKQLYAVDSKKLEAIRLTGALQIVPEVDEKVLIHRKLGDRVDSMYRLCLDETGHFENATLLVPSGAPGYDRKILRTLIGTWTFKPYVHAGTPIPVCANFKFIYTQK